MSSRLAYWPLTGLGSRPDFAQLDGVAPRKRSAGPPPPQAGASAGARSRSPRSR